MQSPTTPRSFPVRQRTSHTHGVFDPTRYKDPMKALQTIVPYPDTFLDDEQYIKLLSTTFEPKEPTIEQVPIETIGGVEESKR